MRCVRGVLGVAALVVGLGFQAADGPAVPAAQSAGLGAAPVAQPLAQMVPVRGQRDVDLHCADFRRLRPGSSPTRNPAPVTIACG